MTYGRAIRIYPIGIASLAVCLSLTLTGCGQSHEERKAQREAEQQEVALQKQREIAELERRFNAKYFPPDGLDANAYTYEVQEFFRLLSGKSVVFHAYMRDLESDQGRTVAVVYAPLLNQYYSGEREVVFRLNVSTDQLSTFMEGRRPDPFIEPDPYFDEPHYVIVAHIEGSRPIRRYEVYGSNAGEYVEVEQDESRNVLAFGDAKEILVVREEQAN